MTDSNVKVTINDTPKPTVVTDSKGRSIELAKPDILAQYDLVDALGDTAKNETYLRMVTPILYVKSIDGEPFFFQNSKAGIRAAIKMLGDEGISAVVDGIASLFVERTEDEVRAAVKN